MFKRGLAGCRPRVSLNKRVLAQVTGPKPVAWGGRKAGRADLINNAVFLAYTDSMPTDKKRVAVIPDNLPANIQPGELCPQVYTADQIFEREPDKYARIAQGLAQGRSALSLAKQEKVATESVAVILKREKDAIDGAQKLTQGLNSIASQEVLLRIIEQAQAGKIPAGALGITFGVLRDKEKADLGQASQTIEVRKTASLEDVREQLNILKAETKAEVIDISNPD